MEFGKKRIQVGVFALIYVVFFGLIAYLLFFNQGLDLVEQNTGNGKELFVVNTTNREIKNVKVYASFGGQKVLLSEFESINANQKRSIKTEILKDLQSATLSVESPFYATVTKTLVLQPSAKEFTFTIETPQIAFAASQTSVSIQTCNASNEKKQVSIELELDDVFFAENIFERTLGLNVLECKKETFQITPIQSGLTTINFNIKGIDYYEKITKELQVN